MSFSGASIGRFLGLVFAGKITPLDHEPLFEDPPEAKRPFKEHYQRYILPHVQQFEEKRVAALRDLRARAIIAAAACSAIAVIAVFAMALRAQQGDGILTIAAFAMAGAVWWASQPVLHYKSSVKSIIFPNVFCFFGDGYHYSEKSPLSVRDLESSGIIPHHDQEHTEDYIKGAYTDVAIELTEARMTKTTGSGKHRRTVTVFQGIFILLEMNKNFSGKTIVTRDGGMIGNWFNDAFNALENVRLEDPVFEKQFEVYSNDQIEARYLLTTSFMERLLQLSELFRSPKIQCSFYDNRLLLMIPSAYNRFETSSVFQPATFVQDITTILAEMDLIFQIIDLLKLNQRTGL